MALLGDAGLLVGSAGLFVGGAGLVDRRVGARRRCLGLSGGNPGAPKGEEEANSRVMPSSYPRTATADKGRPEWRRSSSDNVALRTALEGLERMS